MVNYKDKRDEFRDLVLALAEGWGKNGLPSRSQLEKEAEKLKKWKKANKIQSIWDAPPVMVTATMDDGLGMGLAIIHLYAEALGMRTIQLGLLQTPETIVEACRQHEPDFLGLTVLQFDTENLLKTIVPQLPAKCRIIAGGPVFSADPDFAVRTGIHFTARDVGSFLKTILDSVQ